MDPQYMYEPLPSMPEEPAASTAAHNGNGDEASPDLLLGSETYDWDAVPNLDQFFTRIYRYWEAKGFAVMLLSRVLNLAALGFTVLMGALLLLYVNWGALQADCLRRDTCDIMEVAVRRHPLEGGLTFAKGLAVLYITGFSAYWLVALAHLVYEVRDLVEVRHFCNEKLGLSERQMSTITWPEVAHRLVQVQRTTRLCIVRDLGEADVVSRIMRKENYLIALINRGVLALSVPLPGLRAHPLLTKTLEWNLYWCVLDALFDDHFRVKRSFLYDERALKRRFRVMAALNLAASPFMLLFLLIYFFMKNAEKFYHHPSTIGARRWSPLAKWRLREFNELPHFITHRLNASHAAAERYIQQFPNHALSHVARFVAFVSGSFAALLLALALIDERLLERDLLGRQIVWWVATVGMVLALSRAFIIESAAAFDPEAALTAVVAHTHYMPRHWRGRAHTREVQEAFEGLFQFKARLFLEELASCLLTPFVLYFSLPKCAGAILRFVESNTVHVQGVGDVCSLAAFDFARHGNAKYGAPQDAPKAARSRQGKMEKSFLSFAAAYPQWEPPEGGPRRFLGTVAAQALQPQAAAMAATAVLAAGVGSGGGGAGTGALLSDSLVAMSAGAGGLRGTLLLQPLQQQAQLLEQRQGPVGGGLSHKGAAAAAGAGAEAPAGSPSGIFASAEIADATAAANGMASAGCVRLGLAWPPQQRRHGHGLAQHGHQHGLGSSSLALLGLGGGAGDAAERVALSQMLLQSIYEEHDEAQQAQQVQQHALNGGAHYHQQYHHHQQQQAWHAAPPSAQQQQAGRTGLHGGSPPRQTWARSTTLPAPAPPGRSRQLSSELSVLSRQPSREPSSGGAPAQQQSPQAQQQLAHAASVLAAGQAATMAAAAAEQQQHWEGGAGAGAGAAALPHQQQQLHPSDHTLGGSNHWDHAASGHSMGGSDVAHYWEEQQQQLEQLGHGVAGGWGGLHGQGGQGGMGLPLQHPFAPSAAVDYYCHDEDEGNEYEGGHESGGDFYHPTHHHHHSVGGNEEPGFAAFGEPVRSGGGLRPPHDPGSPYSQGGSEEPLESPHWQLHRQLQLQQQQHEAGVGPYEEEHAMHEEHAVHEGEEEGVTEGVPYSWHEMVAHEQLLPSGGMLRSLSGGQGAGAGASHNSLWLGGEARLSHSWHAARSGGGAGHSAGPAVRGPSSGPPGFPT